MVGNVFHRQSALGGLEGLYWPVLQSDFLSACNLKCSCIDLPGRDVSSSQ